MWRNKAIACVTLFGCLAVLILVCVGQELRRTRADKPQNQRQRYPKNFVELTLSHKDLQLHWNHDGDVPGGRGDESKRYTQYLQRCVLANTHLFNGMTADAKWLLNVYDGHRERIEYHSNSRRPQEEFLASSLEFENKDEIDCASHRYPVFDQPLLAFCKHSNDPTVTLVPDLYIDRDHGITRLEQRLGNRPLIPLSKRRPQLIFRAGFQGRDRHRLSHWIKSNHHPLLNIRENDYMSQYDMCKYQIQLDVDGETNAWDALRWKLLSGSLVIKLRSHWTQWYYEDLLDRIHLVYIDSFDQLLPTVEYYLLDENGQKDMASIAEQGRRFALSRFCEPRSSLDAATVLSRTCTTLPWLAITTFGEPRRGRFANQLLQYVFLRVVAYKNGINVLFTNNWVGKLLFTGCVEPPLPSSLMAKSTICDEQSTALLSTKSSSVKDGEMTLDGFFQVHTSLYRPYRAHIVNEFLRTKSSVLYAFSSTRKQILDKCPGAKIVAFHVRRGDYGPAPFHVAPISWYITWLRAQLWSHEPCVVYIASDERTSVENELQQALQVDSTLRHIMVFTAASLKIECTRRYPFCWNGPASFFTDFYMLQHADAVAISNSSFSFAAALLNATATVFARPCFERKELYEFDPWDSIPVIGMT